MLRFKEKREWNTDSKWIMEQYAKILTKVSIINIKFVIPPQNWAVSLCVQEMFSKDYPIEKRTNLFFNPIYLRNLSLIYNDIDSKNFDFRSVLDLLKK